MKINKSWISKRLHDLKKTKVHKKLVKKILPYKKRLLTFIKTFRDKFIFSLYLRRVKVLNFFRFRASYFLNHHKFWLVTCFYFLFLGLGIALLGRFGKIVPIEKTDAITFFTASGAMVGGILAITFSLSILLMGYAAERIPVGFYEIAARNKFHDVIFFVISACSLIIFSLALLFGRFNLGFSVMAFQLALVLVGLVFYLTFIFYQEVMHRLNPTNVLKIAKNQALQRMNKTHKLASEIAQVLVKQPDKKGKVNLESALASSFQHPYFQKEFAFINTRLNYLFDYHDKLVSSNERSSALDVLQTITLIVQKYFQTRKDSSLVLPAGFLLATTSDSRAFLTSPLERLVAVGEKYMRDNDNEGITRVISVFVQLCQSASKINYLTKRKVENPILKQCRGYLGQLLQSAIKFNYQEALFQGAVAYSQITPIAIKQELHHEFIPIYEMLDKIAISALTNRFNVVSGEVINTYTAIMSQLISSRYFNLEIELRSLMKHLRDIIFYAYVSMITGRLENSFATQTNMAVPFDNLSPLIFHVARAATEAKKEDERKDWKNVFFVTVEELRSTLRYLSEKMKNPNHILVNTFGNMIGDIGCLLLDLTQNDKWVKDKKELDEQIGSYIFQTEWFAHDVKKIRDNLSFDSLVEAAAKIGLRALQRNQDQTAKDAIKIISNFAHKMLLHEKGKAYGFTEPKIMERACYIGILALKLGKKEIVKDLKKYIKAFEEAYTKKWFSDIPKGVKLSSPTKDQLMMEVHGLIREIRQRYGHRPLLDRSSEVLAQLINEEDVNKFILEVWRVKIETKSGSSMFF